MLDLSRYLPGPYCSMILADLGMEVLKVEDPLKGDPARSVGPRRSKDSVYFLAVNRNKRSIGINLKTEEGKEIFRRLCSRYDVLLENFKPGAMDALGFGYGVVSELNPSLVFCSISGYGQNGPYRDRPGHDINYVGLAGLLDMTGEQGGPPAMPGILIGDLTAGLQACIGILTALVERNSTGRGRYVDISVMDGVVSLLCYHIAKYGLERKHFARGEMEFNGLLPCYRVYETADHRFMALGAMDAHFWKNFCLVIGHPDWAEKQWASGAEGKRMISELEAIFKMKSQEEWKECLAGQETCCEPVRSIEDLISDPQVIRRRMIVETEHPQEGAMLQVGNPTKFSEVEERFEPSPSLGYHTEEVLADLGYEPSAILRLREQGVI